MQHLDQASREFAESANFLSTFIAERRAGHKGLTTGQQEIFDNIIKVITSANTLINSYIACYYAYHDEPAYQEVKALKEEIKYLKEILREFDLLPKTEWRHKI